MPTVEAQMTLKACSKCKQGKPLDAFSRRGSGLQPVCRECRKLETRAHYASNREYYLTKTKEKRQRIAAWLREFKHMKPCADCKVPYPSYVLEFDHRDPSTKRGNVAHLPERGSWKLIREEIAKCDLICSNCHAERTHRRGQSSNGQDTGLISSEMSVQIRPARSPRKENSLD